MGVGLLEKQQRPREGSRASLSFSLKGQVSLVTKMPMSMPILRTVF